MIFVVKEVKIGTILRSVLKDGFTWLRLGIGLKIRKPGKDL